MNQGFEPFDISEAALQQQMNYDPYTIVYQEQQGETQGYDNTDNFDRVDARGSFFVGTRNALHLHNKRTSQGKICVEFVKYGSGEGHKATGSGRFYLSFADFEQIRNMFDPAKGVNAAPGTLLKGLYAGMTTAEKGVRSRILEIAVANKPGAVLISYKEGPGKKDNDGRITPAGRPEVFIQVPVAVERFRAWLDLGQIEIENARITEKLEEVMAMVAAMQAVIEEQKAELIEARKDLKLSMQQNGYIKGQNDYIINQNNESLSLLKELNRKCS